jgi:hypothetical protein
MKRRALVLSVLSLFVAALAAAASAAFVWSAQSQIKTETLNSIPPIDAWPATMD